MPIYILLLLVFSNFNNYSFASNKTIKYIRSKINSLPAINKQVFANDKGKLCEFIARELVAKKYSSSHYLIKTNIAYDDRYHHNLGELDLVVFNRQSRNALFVIEVKCQKNREKAYKHAHRQLHRFLEVIRDAAQDNSVTSIYRDKEVFSPRQFFHTETHIMMPKHSPTSGPHAWEFDFTLDDVKKLQEMLAVNK